MSLVITKLPILNLPYPNGTGAFLCRTLVIDPNVVELVLTSFGTLGLKTIDNTIDKAINNKPITTHAVGVINAPP